MLRQEINLYRHFHPPKTNADLVNWKRFWIFNITVFILMTIICITSFSENIYLRKKDKDLQAQLVIYQTEFEKLKGTFPQLFFDKDINEAVKTMQSQIAAQQDIISILSKHTAFSENLIAFSRTIVPNVWLNLIDINKNGDDILIKGNGIGISNLHAFIANLQNDKIFGRYTIEIKEVKNKDLSDPKLKLSFEIQMAKKTS
jgi:hypothetical protein